MSKTFRDIPLKHTESEQEREAGTRKIKTNDNLDEKLK